MMKKIKILFIILFLILILLPISLFNFKTNQVSMIDNRNLTELNIELSDKDLSDNFNQYVNDRIGLRDQAIGTYTSLNDILFKKMVHPLYTYGKDGYVFFKLNAESPDYEFIQEFCKYLRLVQDFCAEENIPFIYCINPSKTTVYQEFLPNGYRYTNYFLEALYQYLDEYEVNYISNVELLRDKAKSEQVYNIKYDAGHWNHLGQYYATNHLLEEVSEYYPMVKPHTLDEFKISTETVHSLPVSEFKITEDIPIFDLKDSQKIKDITEQYDWVKVDPNFPFKKVFVNESQKSALPSLLFFHGSYYNSNQDFYKSSFSETYAIHNYGNFLNFKYYYDIFKPDCVILESAEYATNGYRFNFDTLKDLNESGLK